MCGSHCGGYSTGLYMWMNQSWMSGWLPNSTRNVGQENTAQTHRRLRRFCDVLSGPGLLNWFSKKPRRGLDACIAHLIGLAVANARRRSAQAAGADRGSNMSGNCGSANVIWEALGARA
mmetsp:Transcript_50199/g.144373  ORF Transcript_50199/g.144373 Transcript_50199/m.144373 type:complete len:119 (+) Transcript_50199:312-668(+)